MNRTDLDGIVEEYLQRLDAALSDVPGPRRRQLVAEITEHLDQARSELPDQTEVALRQLLDRVGPPEDIAAEALADVPERRQGRSPLRPAALVLGLVVLVALGATLGLLASTGSGASRGASGAAGAHGTAAAHRSAAVTPEKRIDVPNVLGLRLAQAASVLQALGLEVRTTTAASSPAPAGTVVSQNPPVGVTVAPGSAEALTVAAPSPSTTATRATTSTAPTATTVGPPARTTLAASSAPQPVPTGIYVDGSQGTPHYFISLVNGTAGQLTGSVDFLYQDGQTSVVFTFDGTANNGTATLHPTAVPQGAGSASQAPASVPSAILATLGQDSLSLGECTSYLRFTRSLAECTFSYSPGGVR